MIIDDDDDDGEEVEEAEEPSSRTVIFRSCKESLANKCPSEQRPGYAALKWAARSNANRLIVF